LAQKLGPHGTIAKAKEERKGKTAKKAVKMRIFGEPVENSL
jgi:hypothetical protein